MRNKKNWTILFVVGLLCIGGVCAFGERAGFDHRSCGSKHDQKKSCCEKANETSNEQLAKVEYEHKIVDKTLESFDKRLNSHRWFIGLLAIGAGFVLWKQNNDYKDAVNRAVKAAEEAEKWEEKAQDKYVEFEKETKERIEAFDKQANNKFSLLDKKFDELDKQVKEHSEELSDESEKQRELTRIWDEALKFYKSGEYKEACQSWEEITIKAEELYKDEAHTKSEYYLSFYNWGLTLFNQGALGGENAKEMYEDACNKFEKVTVIKNDYYDAFNYWAHALVKRADLDIENAGQFYEEACQKCEKSIEINSDNDETFNAWGAILVYWARSESTLNQEKLKEAENVLLKAEAISKGSGAYNLACVFGLLRNENECKRWLKVCEEAGTLGALERGVGETDLELVWDKDWFKELKWKG